MANKEYEVKYDSYSKTYTVKEKEDYDYDWEPNTNPTWREKLGAKMQKASYSSKVFFTLFGNFYGNLYRIGSDSTLSFLLGAFNLLYGTSMLGVALAPQFPDETRILLVVLNPAIYTWIIDVISVIVKKDIVFLKGKKYLNYDEYKKKH